MWAAHQVHHSSEYYNLSTALRQSVLQAYTSWVCTIHYVNIRIFVDFMQYTSWVCTIHYVNIRIR